MKPNGKFIISLDFELMWGIWDKRTIESYGQNILGEQQVIPRLLDCFANYNIKATFAAVGFLFFENKIEFFSNLPDKKPSYSNSNLSPYIKYIDTIGNSFEDDPYHYAPHLLRLIQKYPSHEISTHTFSHYYCLEKGQTVDQFRDDLKAAIKVADKYGIKFTSLIFPRNQFNEEYLQVCKEAGIICIRGNEHSWLYAAKSSEEENLFRRALRLVDAYLNISGHNCYADEYLKSKIPVDVPSSRFLRPYSKKLRFLDGLRLNRIKSGMTHAAKNGLTYHLWWHPHNFGIHQNDNFNFLEKLLIHYSHLNRHNNFESLTMSQLAQRIINK